MNTVNFTDLLGALIPIFAVFAYRQPLRAMLRVVGTNARLTAERAGRYWQHRVAVHLRRLLWVALVINVAVMGCVYYYLIAKADAQGVAWMWTWIIGFVASIATVLVPIVLLWGTNGYSRADLDVIYNTPVGANRQQLRAYVRRVREIERRVGPPSRVNAWALFGLVFGFIFSGACLALLAGELYIGHSVSIPDLYVPMAAGFLLLLFSLGGVVAASAIVGAVVETAGGFAIQMLGIVIRMVLTAGPFITRDNWREWVGGGFTNPAGAYSQQLKGAFRPYLGAVGLLAALYICVPHPLFVLVIFPMLLLGLWFLEKFLSWTMGEETSKKLLAALLKLIISLLILYRAVTIVGILFYGWPEDMDHRIFRFLVGWSNLTLQAEWASGLQVALLCAVIAGFFFWATKKLTNPAIKAGVTILGTLFGAIVFMTLLGWIATRLTGERKPTLEHLLAVGSETAAQPPHTTARNTNTPPVAQAPAKLPPRRTARVAEAAHQPPHARSSAHRDPCEGLPASFRGSSVGRRRCR